MKNQLLLRSRTGIRSFSFVLAFSVFFLHCLNLSAQVNFTQTTDADFNKGVLNNVIVGSNNVYLQFGGSDVGTWLTTTVLPQILTGHKTASWNNRYVYLVGGYNNLTYSSSVYVATIQTSGISAWTALNPLPVAMRDMAVVVGTNTLYVLGGRDGSNVYNTIYYAAINMDGTIGAWQTSAVTLPVPLWGHTALYLKGYIYVTGGTSSTVENSALNSVYYACVKANNSISAFSTGANLPAPRNRHSMVTYNSKLYVLGGYDNAGTKSNSVYIADAGVDGSPGAWASGTNLPVAVSNHASVVTNGLITVMAGAVGASLSNTVYFASADAGTLAWTASGNVMYDFTKDGSAFTGNGQVYYTGGTNLSSTPILNCRFANITLTSNYINHGVFVSNPFFELGALRYINSLTFNSVYTAPGASCQVTYRTAGSDGIWGDWTALTSTSPIPVNLTRQYLQYAVILSGSSTFNATFNDMTLTTPGTQLTGNLNAITTFTKALSPYWATGDISFTSGTHTFEAGATILFLAETGLTVSQANINCNGTSTDSVKFTYYTAESGKWDGIYFDQSSDAGVSSHFYYTVISNAGFGNNNANLYCYQTNEPLLVQCDIAGADGNGIRLNEGHLNIQQSKIRNNSENGLHLTGSNPTLVSSTISYNGAAGVYLSSTASVPNFSASTTTIDHNLYALHYPSPNATFSQPNGSPVITDNTYNGIAIDGGDINGTSRWWNSITYDYFILGNIRVMQYYGNVRLTIEPGNTLRFVSGTHLQIGTSDHGGELYALGTSDSTITFTSYNGLPGGWEGIYFHPTSDSWSGHSQLDYCVIDRGNAYNYFSEGTAQPDVLNHSIISNAALDGARYSSGYGTITNCQFLDNGRYPLYYLNPEADPAHSGNTYSGNGINKIALSGGSYTFDRTILFDGIPYYILNDIIIMSYYSQHRLTIEPGNTLEFATGKKLQVGQNDHGGELYAQGTLTQSITFKAYSDTPGGWTGIYFHPHNDNYGGTSVLEYCTIDQGNTYNLYTEGSAQPTLTNCTISNSAGDGMVEYQSSPQIHSCLFIGNNGYPLKYNDWTCNSHLQGNTYTANLNNYIALSGGDYTSDRTFYYDGIPYHVLGDIRILKYYSYCRITIEPGNTLLFNPNLKLQIGTSDNGGELYATGTATQPITFKAYNDTPGGWNGLYFYPHNDDYGGTSNLAYCEIMQGNTYNIYIHGSGQPALTNCTISNSAGNGILELQSSAPIHYCNFISNNGYPLKYNDWSCNSHLKGNVYTGNVNNYIALSGGDYTSARTLYYDGIPYHVLGDIKIIQYYSLIRLTIEPGNTLLFNPGLKLQVGQSDHGGELYAEGKSDSLILFKPFNDTPGGWNGIYFHPHNDSWGGTSSLKYCTIEKGASYNLFCDGSAQPTLDHCMLTQSTGDGMKLTSSSNTVKNCCFSYNTLCGIAMDGSSNPTIGGSEGYTCNFHSNGSYDLMNNTTNNVNARYNYWNTGDSTMAALGIYDKSDNSAKGYAYFVPFAQVPSLHAANTLLGGTLKYANAGANPMKNAAMAVKDFTGANIVSATSNASGAFTLPAFASGSYRMTITPSNPWGGVNATDALAILNHFAMIAPLTGMKYAAADVNYSHWVNGTDALLVMKRYSGLITSFPVGDYLYDSDTLIMNGGNATNDIVMLCFGDVNASYSPAKKSSSSLDLVYEGTLQVGSFGAYTLPVKVKTGMKAGAISLGFYYPEEYMEITGAKLANGTNDFSWSSYDGLFRMGWCDLNPLELKDDGVVVVLTIKTKDVSSLASGIHLELYEDCEFADALAVPNDWEVISIPEIISGVNGVGIHTDSFRLTVAPNPVKDHCIVTLNLTAETSARLIILNQTGSEVLSMVKDNMKPGEHQLKMNTANLSSGLYFLKAELTEHGQKRFETIKLVVSK